MDMLHSREMVSVTPPLPLSNHQQHSEEPEAQGRGACLLQLMRVDVNTLMEILRTKAHTETAINLAFVFQPFS